LTFCCSSSTQFLSGETFPIFFLFLLSRVVTFSFPFSKFTRAGIRGGEEIRAEGGTKRTFSAFDFVGAIKE
jgi:hypothetical protein